MSYVLEKMLTVRKHRENKARNHVVRSKAQLAQAEALKDSKAQELSAYHSWRLEEEERMLATFEGQSVVVQDLLCFRSTVRSLRAHQSAKFEQVAAASKQVAETEEQLQAARQAHATAFRQEAKIKAHRKSWMQAYRLEVERAAENEMDACARSIAATRNEAL